MDVKYRFNGFTVDPVRRLLYGADGQPIPLKQRVFDTLLFLIEHRGELLEKQTLLDAIWPHVVVEENNLNQAISTLRRVFGETRDDHRFIVTEPGRGYRFVAQVEVGSPDDRPSALLEPNVPAERARRSGILWGAAAVVAASALAGAWLGSSPTTRPVPDGELRQLVHDETITAYAGNEVGPALSPDGASVVFSRDDESGSRDLYITRIGGSGAQRLTVAPEPDRFPAWSLDGAEIAFLRQMEPNAFDLIIEPAVGGHERRITTVFLMPVDFLGSPPLAWTPQGDSLLFTSRDDDGAAYHIYRLTLATGERVSLTTGDNVYDTSPAMSPDGRWLAFVRHADFATHMRGTLIVQRLGADAGARESIVVPVNAPEKTIGDAVHSPHWSADGRHLTFVAGVELREWELGATESRLVYPGAAYFGGITGAGDISALTMVRDGHRARAVVARINLTSDIFALPLDPSTHAGAGPPIARLASSAGDIHPRFSPDGRRVAFVSTRDGRPELWIAMAEGSAPTQLTNMNSPIVGFPRWSPDGKRIAFHAQVGKEREVFVVDLGGGVPQRIAVGCCMDWSARGDYVYAMEIGEEHKLSRTRTADGQHEPLFTGSFPTLTVDGSRLLYGKLGERNVYARAVDGDLRSNPEEILVTDAAYPAGIAATTDGFFYLGYTPEKRRPPVRFYDYATHTARTVAIISGRSAEILTLSPDETELLYGAQAESGADLVLLEFGEPWR